MATSIRTRLTVIFIGLAIGPLIVMGVLLSQRSFQHQQQQSVALQQAQARSVAVEVLAFIRQIETELRLVIHMQDLETLDDNETAAILAQLPALNRTIESLYLLNSQGHQILQVARIGIVNESSLHSWQDQDEFIIPATGATFYSPIKFDTHTSEPLMHIAEPIYNLRTGEVDGVLIAVIRVKPIWNLIAGIRVSKGESIYIVDNAGRIVAHPNRSIVLRSTTTSLPARDGFHVGLFGDEVVLAMEPIQLGEQRFVVVAEKLRKDALALAIDTVQSTAVLTAFVLLLATILGVVVVRQIVRPIEVLAVTAQAIQAGNLSQQAPVTTVDEIGALASAFNEMTQQLRQTMEGLRHSEERYRELFENANDIVYTHDLSGCFLTVNRQVERVSGYARAELLQMKLDQLIAPAYRARARKILLENLLKKEVATYELKVVAKNGRTIPLEISSRHIYENGRVVAIQSIARDISERKQAEMALRESEARTRALINAIPDLMFRISRAGVFLDYYLPDNKELYIEPAKIIDQHINETLPTDLARAILLCIERALATGEMQLHEYQLHTTTGLQDYEARYVVSGENEVLAVIRNITEKKRVAESMYQAQKLESIGLLAGGIAHDFNNLLTGMMAQNSLALAKLPADEPARRHIEKATQAAHRAADLTRQLLAYAGKGRFQIGLLDLNNLIQENVDFLETVMPPQAELKLSLATNLPAVEADKGQIQQLVMNLVMNAAEAIEVERGMVTVSTQLYKLSQDEEGLFVGNEPPTAGHYVLLQVADTGVGMSQETLTSIFDPFFTTKMLGRGLGLSATLGIIQTHGGALQVESEVGVGTTFRVYLPAAAAGPTATNERLETPKGEVGGIILVIDDEAPIREAVADVLEVIGLQVLAAANGREGITLFQQHQPVIELVLLDMQMPIMSGEETFVALQNLQPDVKVILSSGYSETEALRRFTGRSINSFLQKPYDLDTLVAKVQTVLAS